MCQAAWFTVVKKQKQPKPPNGEGKYLWSAPEVQRVPFSNKRKHLLKNATDLEHITTKSSQAQRRV